jgi:DNA-binding transcriptional MerR regulator/methylmalonyl-CoA mutase cobalamin-binding subunit
MYSIKAVSQATGLSVETLRAWERRYGIVAPERDDLGRRVYRPEDVLRLRRLREATDHGHPIGRLAQLGEQQLVNLLEGAASTPLQATCNAFVERILEAAQRFRAAECEQSLTLAIAMLPLPQLSRDVLRPLLQEVGDRWHRGDFTIAQERMVSSSVRKHVAMMLDTYDRCAHRPAMVFATLPGERHEIGLLMSAMICASQGYKVHYLGPDLPPEEIAQFAREVGAIAVAISIVLLDSSESVPAQLERLSRALGSTVPIWLGGAGTHALPLRDLPPSCVVVQDQTDFEQRLDMLVA